MNLLLIYKYLLFNFMAFLKYGNTILAIIIKADETIMIDLPAPEFNLPDLDRVQFNLSSCKGNSVVILILLLHGFHIAMLKPATLKNYHNKAIIAT
jgi:hypothetical protein